MLTILNLFLHFRSLWTSSWKKVHRKFFKTTYNNFVSNQSFSFFVFLYLFNFCFCSFQIISFSTYVRHCFNHSLSFLISGFCGRHQHAWRGRRVFATSDRTSATTDRPSGLFHCQWRHQIYFIANRFILNQLSGLFYC